MLPADCAKVTGHIMPRINALVKAADVNVWNWAYTQTHTHTHTQLFFEKVLRHNYDAWSENKFTVQIFLGFLRTFDSKINHAATNFSRRLNVLMFFWPISWIDYTPITNLMHRLLFIHKILLFFTCFEHQVLIFRRT